MNDVSTTNVMLDDGCLTYGLISPKSADQLGFVRVPLNKPRQIIGIGGRAGVVHDIAKGKLELGRHTQTVYLYILPRSSTPDSGIILGRPWMKHMDALLYEKDDRVHIRKSDTWVSGRTTTSQTAKELGLRQVSAAAFHFTVQRIRRQKEGRIFSVTLADIQKALKGKTRSDPNKVLPGWLKDLAEAWSYQSAWKVPPLRPGFNHRIELVDKDKHGKEPELPWGPLYNMSTEELLVLRKELTHYLDKGYIRASRSSAGAPVLFAKKPGGGLRFCVDYRALNEITKKDRYPLPLITETLNRIAKAKYLTKLDIILAFHKIRIEPGFEHMTAFRTRYGQFEWLVMPFGLTGCPATFQRYVNHILRDYLDDFVSAYIDDILIFTNGSRAEHRRQVRAVVERLRQAGLYLDVDKCEFETKRTKYLGYIIQAGESIQMDPEKLKAIREWEAPTSVKGVRSFIGFANFYRRFIKDFSNLAAPLIRLTGKNSTGKSPKHMNISFRWTAHEQRAFDKLKEAFISEPILQHFQPDHETIVEPDASGYAIGGVLLQRNKDGVLHPCAYLSKKMSPAESNYEIHDKELLAVIRCLEEWDSELRSVTKPFTILSDHKNLEFFMQPRKLTERHVRWSIFLSRYNLIMQHKAGSKQILADALSRREQDLPAGDQDSRISPRRFQLLRPSPAPVTEDPTWILLSSVTETPVASPETSTSTAMPNNEWSTTILNDYQYQEALEAIRSGSRTFPQRLGLKVSLSECSVINEKLHFRERLWVPRNEPLRTNLIQRTHDSPFTGHPGREQTYKILSRDFFWPGMSEDVRRYVRNCDICGRTKPWRELTRGYLKPLPVPERIWSELSMDFVTDLPKDKDGNTSLMVTTDRLGKDVRIDPLPDITTETAAKAFLNGTFRNHGLPKAIVSDRGSQFTSEMWQHVCQNLRVQQRLSTAYHPQTDGSTERMNSTLEAYLRAFCSWKQDDWSSWCPIAELAIRNRDAASTGVSPFFMTHGYHVDLGTKPITTPETTPTPRTTSTPSSRRSTAESIIRKLRNVWDFAQASLAENQAEQEKQANRHRKEAPKLQIGDKVWLRLGSQLSLGRPCGKLDWKNAKYTVVDLVGSHAAKLNTPPGIHPVFHVDRLRLASSDPLPSQTTDDSQPPPIQVHGEEEYIVETILSERIRVRGRGKQKQYEVKWKGYAQPTWEPATNFDEVSALQDWIDYTAEHRDSQGNLPKGFRRET